MEKAFKTLQLFYASVLADSVSHYHRAGILDRVTEKKAAQQEQTAAPQLKQLGINTPEELFGFFSGVFGCIQWQTEKGEAGLIARGNHCLLCSMAKKMQSARPCSIYCINPMRAMLRAMDPAHHLTVEKTLWDHERCEFKVVVQNE